mmetsp:Transcript_9672/g.14487  ORF Transcript_9672/g.14487 Transcript_9672/m.14487 type:complete len:454 (+) Transcript_9672:52-1413(+)
MGLDGGTIPTRAEILRGASWKLNCADGSRSTRGGSLQSSGFSSRHIQTFAEKAAASRIRLGTCALSGQPLDGKIRACRVGNLYNHEAVVQFIHDVRKREIPKSQSDEKFKMQKLAFSHLKSLKKDTFIVKLQRASGSSVITHSRLKIDVGLDFPVLWQCPITGVLADGKRTFVCLRSCGHVFSETAVKAVMNKKTKRKISHRSSSSTAPGGDRTISLGECCDRCMICGKPFDDEDIITLAPERANLDSGKSSRSLTVQKEDRKSNSQKLSVIPAATSNSKALVKSNELEKVKPRFRLGSDVLVKASNGKVWNPAVVIEIAWKSKSRLHIYSVEYTNGHISRKLDSDLRVLAKLRCPLKHRLKRFLAETSGYDCNVCKRVNLPEGYEMYGCRKCDWDACYECFKEFSASAQKSQLQNATSKSSRTKRKRKRKETTISEKRKLELLHSMGGRWTR